MLRPAAPAGDPGTAGRATCPYCGHEVTDGRALSERPADTPGITPRESDVLDLLTEGLTDRQIARRLGISPRTVDKHLGHAYSKLEVTGRVAAATRWLLSRDPVPPHRVGRPDHTGAGPSTTVSRDAAVPSAVRLA